MRRLRLWYPRVLVWLILAWLAGLVPVGQSLAIPADGAPPRSNAFAQQPAGLAPANQPPASPPPPTAVASGTPTVTLTPTLTPTTTPSPTATPPATEPQPRRDVRISLAVTPEEVRPGDVLTYTIRLTNAGHVRATNLVISDTLPSGLIYVPHNAGNGQYDPPTRRLTWSLAGLDAGTDATFSFQARVVPAAPNPTLNTVEVSSPDFPGRPTATASVHVLHAAELVVLPDAATQLAAPGGRILLDIPAGAVTQPARFAYQSLAARRLALNRTGLALQFKLTARPANGGPNAPPITRFEKPLRLTVDLTDLLDVDALGSYKTWFVGYRDETADRWVRLPVVDVQPGPVVTVEVDHFTPFGAGAQGVEHWGWAPTFNNAHVSLFNGGFTYYYPIDVPPGRAGLTPRLNLSYSSRRVDGVISWIQPDWVGLGWSMDSVEIVRQGVRRCPGNPTWVCYKDEFTLVLNGTAYDLKPATGTAPFGRYHTADESFLYIERRDDQSGADTREYWVVRTRDGTEYELGNTPDSGQSFGPHLYDANGDGQSDGAYPGGYSPTLMAYRWRVNQVADPHGNRIVYRYDSETKDQQCSETTNIDQDWRSQSCVGNSELDAISQRAHYLKSIEYNHLGDDTPGVKIVFTLGQRGTTNPVPPEQGGISWGTDGVKDLTAPIAYGGGAPLAVFWQRHYLQSIQVQVWNQAAGQHDLLREYVLTYVEGADRSDPPMETRLLQTITLKGRDGQALPATAFSYTAYPNKGWCGGCASNWAKASFDYDRLTAVNNGYGGVIGVQDDTYDDDVVAGSHTRAYNYRVLHRETQDRGTVVGRVDYTYPSANADRCYDENDDRVCEYFNPGDGTGGRLVGYRNVTETLKDGNGSVVAVTEHDFHLNSASDPTWKLGREAEARYKEPNGTTLRTVQRSYVDHAYNPPSGVHFVYLSQVDTYAGDPTAAHARTKYDYDLTYGNLTREYQAGDVIDPTDDRTIFYTYYPNPTDWVVDRVARETVYAGDHSSDDSDPTYLKARTRYRYDNQICPWEVPPTQGQLTHIDRWNAGSGVSEDCYADAFDTTVYGYDAFGNRISVTDSLSHTATMAYDGILHSFPITRTNALGQTTVTTYYGVNGSPATGSGAYFGQVEAVTDPNGATTTYTYDAFGRLATVRRPGDEEPAPATVQYTYFDNPQPVSLPFRIQEDRRQDSSTVLTTHRFYDGLGRPIETKEPLPGNQQAVQHTAYNARGLVAEAYVPYTVTTGAAYVPVDPSKPKTSYTYDALGRPTLLTHPDGRTVQTGYAGWRTTVVDENGHQKVQEQDAFGRLAQVEEYTGTGPYTLYATTTYAYNVLDRLRVVTDTTGITTTIAYDPLGRKVSMDDPDMGTWSYEYDAAGNLTSQTDGRGCTTTFSYDGLNRLTGKTYGGPGACGGTSAVSYGYDDGPYGVSRRTGMTDGSGSTSWGYDARRRVVTETVRLGALGTYTTTYGYDSQDQVVTTTYPDDEVVTTTYNIAGWPATLTSSLGDSYVPEATYNAQGQSKTIQYGNALVTRFGYYGYNGWGIGDTDDAPDQSWANGHVGKLWKLCTVPFGQDCPQAGNSSSVLDLRYGYDAVGNVASLRDKTNSDQVQWFSYDDLDRLTQAYTDSVGQGQYNRSYSYDEIGNLTDKSDLGTYSYSPGKPHAVTAAGSNSYGYDANGNMTSRSVNGTTYTLSYDAENRLQSVTNTATGEVVTFTYDGDGRRVLRDTATDTVAYVGSHYELRFTKTDKPEDLDDDCRVTVVDIMEVASRWGEGSGSPGDLNGDGTVDVGDIQQVAGVWRETCHVLADTTKYYALGDRRIAMQKVPVGQQQGTLYYLFSDHLGSTSVSYRSGGGDTQTQRYYPWGTIRPGPDNTLPTDFTFTGQKLDESTGLMYYGARYYEPALGRFMQPDTIVPEPGNPQALNRYSYVYNNPLKYTDPSGHMPPPGAFKQWEVGLPSWAQSGLMQRALNVGCWFLSCHVDAERGVLQGPTPEEQAAMIQPVPMSVAGGVVGNLADDVVDDVVRAGAKKVEQRILPGFEDLVLQVEQAIRSEIRAAGKLLGRRVPDTEVHHLIEKRFVGRFGVDPNDIPAVRLDKTFHQQEVTARLFKRENLPTYPPRQFSLQKIWNTYKVVYGKQLGQQDWLEAIWPYFERTGEVVR